MKRTFTAIVCTLLLVAVLAGCGSTNPFDAAAKTFSDEGMTITLTSDLSKQSMDGYTVCYAAKTAAVFALHEKPEDAEARDWVLENAPHVNVVRSESYDDIIELGLPRNAVCVGFDCAYLLKAPHFVALQKDEGLFGYQAVWQLMKLMMDSLTSTTEWEG